MVQSVRFVSTDAPRLPADFVGLSFETLSIEPGNDGKYQYFSAANLPLIQLFHTLGIHNLRIGGNTSDNPAIPVPQPADMDALFAFARAADVKVIYTLRLRSSDTESAVPAARYLMSHYADLIACMVIGNEPDIYQANSSEDNKQILRYVDAMQAGGVTPLPRLCGPSTTPAHPEWAAQFASEVGSKADLLWVTQHSYPGGNGRKVASPASGREALLNGSFDVSYKQLLDSFAPEIQQRGLHYRIEETNNYYFGGAKDVSNTFAAALWGLDYLYWWAEHGAAGVNFHTGDQVAAADEQTPCWYATFWTAEGGVQAKPLAYAIAAFNAGAHGRVLSPQRSNADKDLSLHATRAEDGDLYVTLINRSHGPGAHASEIVIDPTSRFSAAELLTMQSSDARVEAVEGITLGSSPISASGHWDGKWKSLSLPGHTASVSVPPASALILHLHPQVNATATR